MNKKLFLILLLFGVFGSLTLHAQEEEDSPNFSPKTVLDNFYLNLSQDSTNPKQAAKSLHSDIKNATDSAELLYKVMVGKGILLTTLNIPKDSNYIDTNTQKARYYPVPTEKRIYLERKNEKWYFSYKTINDIPQMYDEVFKFTIAPDTIFKGEIWKKKFLNIRLSSWVGIFLLSFLCILIYKFLNWIFQIIDFREITRKGSSLSINQKYFLQLGQLISLLIASRIFIVLLPSLNLPLVWNSLLLRGVGIASVFFVIMILNKLVSGLEYVLFHSRKNNKTYRNQTVHVFAKILRFLIWTFGIIYILYAYLNINVTALLAGISIGGLAIALAAQDTVKNFIGSAIILIDKPFDVNDWIQYDKYEGMVVDIGIRSTRLQTMDGNYVYIPNNLVSNNVLSNKGVKTYKNYKTILTLDYNTPIDKLEEFVKNLNQIIMDSPYTHKENQEVHIYELADSSINVMFLCFFDVANNSEEYKARHAILVDILQLAEKMGVNLAYPSQTIYFEKESQ